MNQIHVKLGEFPYPLIDGPDESRYLTWVRNHSNYLAERGFLDYLRIVAVLVRGILINFIILLPMLLLGALLLSAYVERGWATSLEGVLGTKAPYLLTPWVAMLTLVWYLLYTTVIRLFRVVAAKQAAKTGSDSSVKLRDRYERWFSGFLVVLGGVAMLESLPLLIEYFHRAGQRGFDFREVLASMAGGSAVLMSAAGKLLSMLGKAQRGLAMVGIALLGLVIPLLVVLHVAEFLIYTDSSYSFEWWYLAVVPTGLALGILLALLLGLVKGTLRSPGWLLGLLGIVLGSVAGLFLLKEVIAGQEMIGQQWFLVLAVAVELWLFSWLAVDINLTSVHGMYRDRLASAFLVGEDRGGDVDIEEDIDLHEICRYDQGSTAPYHLVNVALNLQGSSDVGVRERNSDFFIFSKEFIGSKRTGYCTSEVMESVFPQMDLATAMAISAAAASPNMGTSTKAPIVAILTMLNIRLGYWVPHPGRLQIARGGAVPNGDAAKKPPGLSFEHDVFPVELAELTSRWDQVYTDGEERRLAMDDAGQPVKEPTPHHGLVGLAFSGGGIRSATINLGIAQALYQRRAFDHADYMSTVSGGGYLGSSISTLMRSKTGQSSPPTQPATLRERFSWRVRPQAFLREMRCQLDEEHRWVNLSDGGHIENMAAIELLRRRCKYIVIGDGEADFEMKFKGLATLVRYARIDLGIHIDINLDALRPKDGRSESHFALGRIKYPNEEEPGYLLYLKSSLTGDEDEVVKEYRANHETFPHESTADQFFDEGQFEAYRALGQRIGESALGSCKIGMTYEDFEAWFETLAKETPNSPWRSQ